MNTQELIDRYFDGRIDRAGHERLGQLIATDPQVAAEFVAAGRMNATLAQHFEESAGRRSARIEIAALLSKSQRQAKRGAWLASIRAKAGSALGTITDLPEKARRRPALTGAIACAGIAIAALVFKPFGQNAEIEPHSPSVVATGTGISDSFSPDRPAATATLLAQQVRRRLGRFYLPEVRIDALPIDEALDILALDLDSVAQRHGDRVTASIAFQLSDALDEDDPRRWRPVSLDARSITAANALQLVAGQAGLNIAYLDGAAELKPRLSANDDSDVRARSFEVVPDFFQRASEIVPGDGTDSNPLAMLGFSPPPSATATLAAVAEDGSTANMSVRATSDDMRSIATLASMLSEDRNRDVEISTRIVNLSPEAVGELSALAAASDPTISRYITAVANPEPADRILTRSAHYRQLVASLNELPGVNVVTQPSVTTGADRPVTMQQQDPSSSSSYLDDLIEYVVMDQSTNEVNGEVVELVGYAPSEEFTTIRVIDNHSLELTGLPEAPTDQDSPIVVTSVADTADLVAADVVQLSWTAELGEQVYWGLPSPYRNSPHSLSSGLVARFEGDSIRLSGTMNVDVSSSNLGIDRNFNSNYLSYSWVGAEQVAEVTTIPDSHPSAAEIQIAFETDFDADAYANLLLSTVSPSLPTSEEIDIDATIGQGETLMLEIDQDDGGKQLIFVSADRR